MSPNLVTLGSPSRPQASPRFSSSPEYNQNYAPAPPQPPLAHTAPPSPTQPMPSKPPHPLLTPSGRTFAVGGKVQNVSTDPLTPCVIYWPDNEPLPEQGQIRPAYLAGLAVRVLSYVHTCSLFSYHFLATSDFEHWEPRSDLSCEFHSAAVRKISRSHNPLSNRVTGSAPSAITLTGEDVKFARRVFHVSSLQSAFSSSPVPDHVFFSRRRGKWRLHFKCRSSRTHRTPDKRPFAHQDL